MFLLFPILLLLLGGFNLLFVSLTYCFCPFIHITLYIQLHTSTASIFPLSIDHFIPVVANRHSWMETSLHPASNCTEICCYRSSCITPLIHSSALDGVEWLTPRSGRFIFENKPPMPSEQESEWIPQTDCRSLMTKKLLTLTGFETRVSIP